MGIPLVPKVVHTRRSCIKQRESCCPLSPGEMRWANSKLRDSQLRYPRED